MRKVQLRIPWGNVWKENQLTHADLLEYESLYEKFGSSDSDPLGVPDPGDVTEAEQEAETDEEGEGEGPVESPL